MTATVALKQHDCLGLQMESDLEAYTVWYPPLRSSLLCLSKLYGSVDSKIFNGLAQDAVHAATASVQVSNTIWKCHCSAWLSHASVQSLCWAARQTWA